MCLGVPAKIIRVMDNNVAIVDVDDNELEISILLIPDVKIGQYVLVHAGFAMQVIDEESAQESMALIREMLKIRESGQYA